MSSNCETAEEIELGQPESWSWTSVMTPRVPSAPTKRAVRSYPVALFLARPLPPHLRTFPPLVTAVTPLTTSLMVP